MALSTYTELKAAISDWAHSDSLTDARLTDIVALAEAKLNTQLRIAPMETVDSLSLTAGASSVSVPTGFLQAIAVAYSSDDFLLVQADEVQMHQWRADAETGRPAYYAIGNGLVLFDVTADATYTFSIRYFKKWSLATDSTNWLLTNRPQVYLYGSLAEASKWLEYWDRAQSYEQMFRQEITELENANHNEKAGAQLRVDRGLVSRGVFDINTGA
jgi:hypothetical protein